MASWAGLGLSQSTQATAVISQTGRLINHTAPAITVLEARIWDPGPLLSHTAMCPHMMEEVREPCGVFFFSPCFLGPHPRHMDISRLVVKLELQLPAYTTGTATWAPRHICNLHHSSRQHQILNPLSEARDGTCILRGTSWICFCCTTMGTPVGSFI